MTVKELIRLLNEHHPDKQVAFVTGYIHDLPIQSYVEYVGENEGKVVLE